MDTLFWMIIGVLVGWPVAQPNWFKKQDDEQEQEPWNFK